jgi:hypothetical protein
MTLGRNQQIEPMTGVWKSAAMTGTPGTWRTAWSIIECIQRVEIVNG